jgi:hypothetical protein
LPKKIVHFSFYFNLKIVRFSCLTLYLETALRVSGGNSTNYQERIQLYLQHVVFVTPLLLPAAKRQVAVTA